jgi:putative transposase
MHQIDEVYTKVPFYGSRKIEEQLNRMGYSISRKKVQRLMHLMGIEAIYPKKNTSTPQPGHKVYPYLLRDVKIHNVNQVWGTDITYIRMHRGWLYLIAIMDWFSRYVISWELSTSLEVEFCLIALETALRKERPIIFNSDQGSQFTSTEFTKMLLKNHIQISMDGRGRAMDNIFNERLWRSVKYEEVYLHEYETVREAKESINRYMNFYNNERLHQSLEYATPSEIYYKNGKDRNECESGFLLMPFTYGSGHQQKEYANL